MLNLAQSQANLKQKIFFEEIYIARNQEGGKIALPCQIKLISYRTAATDKMFKQI